MEYSPSLRDAAQAFTSASQQFHGNKQYNRYNDHHGGYGRNGGVVFFTDAGKHLSREGVLLGARYEQGHDDFIEGGHKCKQRA